MNPKLWSIFLFSVVFGLASNDARGGDSDFPIAVVITVNAQAGIVRDGKVMGEMQLQKGVTVTCLSGNNDRMLVEFRGLQLVVATSKTDLTARLQAKAQAALMKQTAENERQATLKAEQTAAAQKQEDFKRAAEPAARKL